ncbi:MAG: hypothetical protein R2848_12495 [Thermomicrobiales bacterium]
MQLRYLLLLLPALIFLIVFYGYPVAAMLARSFNDPELGLENFRKLTNVRRHEDFLFLSIPSNGYIHVFLITLRIAGAVTLLTLLLGYPVAYVLSSIRDSRQSAADPGVDPVLDQHPRALVCMDGATRARGIDQPDPDQSGHPG